MHHHFLMHLLLETKVSIIARIGRTLRLDQPCPNLVRHKEVVGLLHVVGVIETTLVSVVVASWVVANSVKRGII